MADNSVYARLTTAGIILVLLFCTVMATRAGLAAIHASPAQKKLSLWRGTNYQAGEDEWKAVRQQLQYAAEIDPGPDRFHELGTAYDYATQRHLPGDSAAEVERRQAYAAYRTALNLRPGWPHEWMSLALIKYRLQETDKEFEEAMHLARTLGPWEPWVQVTIADIGLHGWNKHSAAIQTLTRKVISDGVRHPDGSLSMLGLAGRYGMLEEICASEGEVIYVEWYCDKHLKKK